MKKFKNTTNQRMIIEVGLAPVQRDEYIEKLEKRILYLAAHPKKGLPDTQLFCFSYLYYCYDLEEATKMYETQFKSISTKAFMRNANRGKNTIVTNSRNSTTSTNSDCI